MTDINTPADFSKKVTAYNKKRYVFRGQIKDHPFKTSFERNECTDSYQKAKWEYYCYYAFKMGLSPEIYKAMNYEDMLIYIDSLLQHYGWRSRQLDITKSIAVAAFFASHKYTKDYMKDGIFSLTEDYDGNFIIEKVSAAKYEDSKEECGYIYIFDMDQIQHCQGLSFVDLSNGLIDKQCRPVKQSGCVVSSAPPKAMDSFLSSTVVEVLRVKLPILLEYCSSCKINENWLFPTTEQDGIYRFLLNLPSKEFINSNGNKTNFYLKELDIPEYHYQFKKTHPPTKAYFSCFWIYDNLHSFKRNCAQANSKDYTYYKCNSDDCFPLFSKEGQYLQMPDLIALMRKQKNVILEFNSIFPCSSMRSTTDYQKGISFVLDKNVISVSQLVIGWAGTTPLGFGELMPRYYKIISDCEVAPLRQDNDCPCNDDDRHLHDLLVGKYFAQMLSEGYLVASHERDQVFFVNQCTTMSRI